MPGEVKDVHIGGECVTFYLVSMPGEVKDVHIGGKCVTFYLVSMPGEVEDVTFYLVSMPGEGCSHRGRMCNLLPGVYQGK